MAERALPALRGGRERRREAAGGRSWQVGAEAQFGARGGGQGVGDARAIDVGDQCEEEGAAR